MMLISDSFKYLGEEFKENIKHIKRGFSNKKFPFKIKLSFKQSSREPLFEQSRQTKNAPLRRTPTPETLDHTPSPKSNDLFSFLPERVNHMAFDKFLTIANAFISIAAAPYAPGLFLTGAFIGTVMGLCSHERNKMSIIKSDEFDPNTASHLIASIISRIALPILGVMKVVIKPFSAVFSSFVLIGAYSFASLSAKKILDEFNSNKEPWQEPI